MGLHRVRHRRSDRQASGRSVSTIAAVATILERRKAEDRETQLRRLGAELRRVPVQLGPPEPTPLHVIAKRRQATR